MLFTGADVINRAISLVGAGPLERHNCSDWCPWCAISIAKGLLDDEHDTGLTMPEVIRQVVTNRIVDSPGDEPLVEARQALSAFNSTDISQLTQEGALQILRAGVAAKECK